jgi:hypothetical protein
MSTKKPAQKPNPFQKKNGKPQPPKSSGKMPIKKKPC